MKHRSRLDLRKYFFSERVVNRWNELDKDTVSATTVNMFKSKLQRLRQFKTSFYTDGHLVSSKLQGLIWKKSIFSLVRPHQVIHQVISLSFLDFFYLIRWFGFWCTMNFEFCETILHSALTESDRLSSPATVSAPKLRKKNEFRHGFGFGQQNVQPIYSSSPLPHLSATATSLLEANDNLEVISGARKLQDCRTDGFCSLRVEQRWLLSNHTHMQ